MSTVKLFRLGWSSTASMNSARSGHAASLLSNGKGLVAGGYNQTATLASAELYDPSTGQWTITDSMNAAQATHGAIVLCNGKVLVFGGSNCMGTLSSAELYDPVTGYWNKTN
ncbi:unnamed protein product, partial [Rotaria sp. Silwood2]